MTVDITILSHIIFRQIIGNLLWYSSFLSIEPVVAIRIVDGVHVLLEPEAELIAVGVFITFFLALGDVFHTLGGLQLYRFVSCRRGAVDCHREGFFQMEIVILEKVL